MCRRGWFGQDCQFECTCRNDAICDHVNGKCHCGLGWTGTNCEKGWKNLEFYLFLLVDCLLMVLCSRYLSISSSKDNFRLLAQYCYIASSLFQALVYKARKQKGRKKGGRIGKGSFPLLQPIPPLFFSRFISPSPRRYHRVTDY